MSPSNCVRFDIFEFDLTTSELRRHGTPINLQSQPSKVLATLLEQAGDVVTRETLQSAVWQSDTHVDFERGLNFCIAQIRSALGDSAESPKFLRTIPKRGYQFIAPLERIAPIDAKVADAPMIPPEPAKRRSAWPIALVIVLILSSLGFYGLYRRNTPIRIAVALFDNETGDPELDRFAAGLTDQVVAELTMSGRNRFDVIGNASVLRVPRAQRDLNTIASTLHSSHVILGQVQRSEDRIRVLAHLIRMPDQTHVWVTRKERTLVDPLRLQLELAQLIRDEFTDKLDPNTPAAPLSQSQSN